MRSYVCDLRTWVVGEGPIIELAEKGPERGFIQLDHKLQERCNSLLEQSGQSSASAIRP